MDRAAAISWVCAQYLASDEAVLAGIAAGLLLPPVDEVPRVAESDATTMIRKLPSIVVKTDIEDSEQSLAIKFANVAATLHLSLGVEAGQTTEETAHGWLEAMEYALMNAAAWALFVPTVDLSRRTGWRIDDRFHMPPNLERDDENNTLALSAVMRLRLMTPD